MKHHLLAYVLGCLPAIAHANINCKEPSSTPEINECAALEFQAVEKKLNETYRRVLKSLDTPIEDSEWFPQIKKDLIEAQKAWAAYREKDCDAVYTLHSRGTIRTVMHISCMRSHTEKRIKDLEDYEME